MENAVKAQIGSQVFQLHQPLMSWGRQAAERAERHIKEELEQTDLDIGPIVPQHMDSYYGTNQMDLNGIKKENTILNMEPEDVLSSIDDAQVKEEINEASQEDSANKTGGGYDARGLRVLGGCGAAREAVIFQPKQLEVPAASEQVAVPAILKRTDSEPSTELLAAQVASRACQQQTKKEIAALAPGQKHHHPGQGMKEMTHFLLLDGPERKRKQSNPLPKRSGCRLEPGTPTAPHRTKPQPWELVTTAAAITHDVTPRNKSGNIALTSSIGVVKVEDLEPENLIVDNADFEWIGFSTSEVVVPAAGPSQTSMVDLPAMTSDDCMQASHWSSPPGSAVPGSSQTIMHKSAGSAVYEDDFEDTLEQREHSSDSGSCDEETEENVVPAPVSRAVAQGFPAFMPEDVSSEISERIQIIDACDDADIRRNVSEDLLNFDWRSDAGWFRGVRETFRGQAGPTFPLSDMDCPLDAFRMIWDEELILLIVNATNRYAERQICSEELQRNSSFKRWKPITTEELWVFLAVIVIQSLIPLPVEEEYWRAFVSVVAMQQFPRVMTFNRFKLLKRCLHFVDSDTQPEVGSPEAEKLFKIMPIINHLNNKFATLYNPGQEMALDESLLQWEGRLSFAQRIATKAAGVGIKSYELCESKTGYLWKFQINTGKSSHDRVVDEPTVQDQPDGMTSRIVYDLASPLFNRGHTLVMDTFYNSPLLSRCLKLNGMDTMGPVQMNREFVPDSLKATTKSQLRIGEFASSQTNDLTILLWRDANLVAMISSFHPVVVSGREKYGTNKYKPQVVLDYNLAMGGVDKKDQLLSAYPMERIRHRVWYKKLFRRLLNISVLNSSILYGYKAHMTERRFRQSLVTSILEQFMPHLINTVPAQLTVVPAGKAGVLKRPNIIGGHYLERGKPRACCVLCRSRTVRQCDACKVPLCVDICFKEYHTR